MLNAKLASLDIPNDGSARLVSLKTEVGDDGLMGGSRLQRRVRRGSRLQHVNGAVDESTGQSSTKIVQLFSCNFSGPRTPIQ